MTVVSGNQLAVGLRHAVIFKLDANGYPAATGSSAYEGFNVVGPKTFTLNVPDVRKISHTGADRVLALDFLPPLEGMSGELQVANDDLAMNAYLTGNKDFDIADANMIPWATDQQGYEPDVALLLFQQSLNTDTKLRNWRFFIIPKAKIVPSPDGMNENAGQTKYAIAPSPSSKHIWGTAMAVGTEGCTEASVIEGQSAGKPIVVCFKGNASTTAFLFPTDKPATAVGKIKCWVNGVLTVPDVVAVTGITISSPPASNAMVVCFYEY